MNRTHLRQLLGLTAAAALTLAALGAGPVSAATPGWKFVNVQQLPATVAPGADAGFKFRILNDGSSNISQLFLTDSVNAAPTYFANSRNTVCTTSPNLSCSFGALNAGDFIDVTIAYKVGNGNFTNAFQLDSTGSPTGKNKSHGDSLKLTLTTQVDSSANFDAGFVVGDSSYATTGTLGRNNKQTSQVDLTDSLVPVTIQDGIASDPGCNVSECTNLIGEWTRLNVPGNSNLLKVTINVWGGSVPGGVGEGDIFLLHVLDGGGVDVIDTTCTMASGLPTNPECLTVTKVGSNYRIVVWLNQNGTLRGGF